MLRLVARASVLLIAALALTACTATPEPPSPTSTAPIVQLGAPGEPNSTLSPEELAELDLDTDHVEQDVDFIRGMLHHHAQALVMTGYVPDRTTNQDVLLLAERMGVSQTDEMRLMEQWLQDRGEPARDPDAAHDEHAAMPGLLTDAQLAQLEAAQGATFDRLFLQYMTMHHEGAIEMVRTLYSSGGGGESAVDQMAREIEADQGIEIARMQTMLAAMD